MKESLNLCSKRRYASRVNICDLSFYYVKFLVPSSDGVYEEAAFGAVDELLCWSPVADYVRNSDHSINERWSESLPLQC